VKKEATSGHSGFCARQERPHYIPRTAAAHPPDRRSFRALGPWLTCWVVDLIRGEAAESAHLALKLRPHDAGGPGP